MLTRALAKRLLHYDPQSGAFTWRRRSVAMFSSERDCRAWNTRFAGKPAGHLGRDGYIYICVNYQDVLAHRLAWLYENGCLPEKHIDHRNGRRADNRISNLRPADHWQNSQNLKVPSSNTSGLIGASWDASRQKWDARIKVRGKQIKLGRFDTAEEAHAAYLAAKRELHTFQPVPRNEELAA